MDGDKLIAGRRPIIKHDAFLEMLEFFATTKSDKEAFVFLSTDKDREVITWETLYSESKNVAHAMLHIGVKRGEVVAVSLRTCPEWLYIVIGAMMIGALPVNLVFTYKDGHDVVAMMEKLRVCSLLALDPGPNNENWNIFQSLVEGTSEDGRVKSSKMPYLRYLICHHPEIEFPGVKMLNQWVSESHPENALPVITPNDTAFLFQTSGSTGTPKIVNHSFKSFTMLQIIDDVGLDFSQTFYNDRPFGWLGGFPFGIIYGQKRVTLSGFSPTPTDKVGFAMNAVKTEGCKILLMLPPAVIETCRRKESGSESDWSVDALITSGMPITSNILKAIGFLCQEMFIDYGGTEFNFISSHRIRSRNLFEEMNCGRPWKGHEVKIVDRIGNEVPENTLGEIFVRSKFGFEGYYNDPEMSKAIITEDGWCKTGDIGKLNEKSELFVMGRMSNEIIRGGMKIIPEILESVLKNCPFVENALIVPIPDAVLYQELCACIKLKPGTEATDDDVRKYCEDVHADSERLFSCLPAHYLIFDAFPVTGTGKESRL